MKKAIVLLLALAVLGGAAFAEDLAYTLTGSASLVWGYNLNTEHHGFTNTTSAKLVVPLVAKQSSTHAEDVITGSITITNFTAGIDTSGTAHPVSASAGTVTAKILFPNDLYIQIASKPDFTVSNAAMHGPISADAWDGDDTAFNPFAVKPALTSSGGFTFGMDGDFSFALMVGSTNTHTAATGEDDYMVGGSFSYAIEELADFGVNFIFGAFQNDNPTTGVGVYANATPVEGLSLYLGADFNIGYYIAAPVDDTFNGMDLQFDVNYEMADMFSVGAGVYVGIPNLESEVGAPLMSTVLSADLLAVENLTFGVSFNMYDILDAMEAEEDIIMAFAMNANYKMMLDDVNYVKPYASFTMIPEAVTGVWSAAELQTVNVGVEAKFFPLTTFTLDFVAGEIDADSIFTGTTMGDVAGKDKGVITFTTKITY